MTRVAGGAEAERATSISEHKPERRSPSHRIVVERGEQELQLS